MLVFPNRVLSQEFAASSERASGDEAFPYKSSATLGEAADISCHGLKK